MRRNTLLPLLWVNLSRFKWGLTTQMLPLQRMFFVQAWNINGLPKDAFSVDNAVTIQNSNRWPLMIDPQNQANRWIKNSYAQQNLKVVKLTDNDFMRQLDNCIQLGLPLLIENVGEDLDPSLEPILLKQVFKQGRPVLLINEKGRLTLFCSISPLAGVEMIRLGDKVIEYSKDFKLFITTKLRNPHYLPEISTKVTLLNFMITSEGLQDQLLGKPYFFTIAEECVSVRRYCRGEGTTWTRRRTSSIDHHSSRKSTLVERSRRQNLVHSELIRRQHSRRWSRYRDTGFIEVDFRWNLEEAKSSRRNSEEDRSLATRLQTDCRILGHSLLLSQWSAEHRS